MIKGIKYLFISDIHEDIFRYQYVSRYIRYCEFFNMKELNNKKSIIFIIQLLIDYVEVWITHFLVFTSEKSPILPKCSPMVK